MFRRAKVLLQTSFSGNVFKRASRKDHDPFLRDGGSARRALTEFRKRPAVVRYSLVFCVGFLFGAIVEVFACKTRLYEAVMVNKDTRRHDLDEFVVDFRKNVERWQTEDIKRSAAQTQQQTLAGKAG